MGAAPYGEYFQGYWAIGRKAAGSSPRELRDFFFCDDDYGVVVNPSLWDISQLKRITWGG